MLNANSIEQISEACVIGGYAEEIIIDLQLLLGSRFFLGLCMSQVARVVASIGLARGELEQAVAMDQPNPAKLLQFVDKTKMGEHMPWSLPS